MMRYLKGALLPLLTTGALTGCFLNVLDPGWDFSRDAEGNTVIADTARMWEDIRGSIDHQVDLELADIELPEPWKDYWERRLSRFSEKSTEQKFQAYILCTRRRFYLPPLSDEWEERFDNRWCEHFAATEGRHTRGLPKFARDGEQ